MAEAELAQNFFVRYRDKIGLAGPDDCWLWSGGRMSAGYGQVRARGQASLAHREAYKEIHGVDSADGLVVRHKCDVPLCVNPAHLEVGTHRDNARDKEERGRGGQLRGEAHGRSKLTEADVRAIRASYVFRSREFGQTALALRHGVSHSVISQIVRRERWQHVT